MKILDLFCKAGGCSMGYYNVGFEVVGVDIKPQPNYPFEFIQSNAFDIDVSDFDAIHASPPCQCYTSMLNHGLTDRTKHPDLINATRNFLKASGKPYVIENVEDAPLFNPIILCGEMFQLKVIRHRIFETNFRVPQPRHRKHKGLALRKRGEKFKYYRIYGHEVGTVEEWGGAMGINWMKTKDELTQAIPPAYTQYIGEYLKLLLNKDT